MRSSRLFTALGVAHEDRPSTGRRRSTWFLALAALASSARSTAQTNTGGSGVPPLAGSTALIFDGVTVVDVEHGKLVPDQRVVIESNHIQTVGSRGTVSIPKRAQVVDARDKYLIPGLWDMHVHVGDLAVTWGGAGPEVTYPLFVVNGVTGVRQMTGPGQQWRQAIASGAQVGPRIFGADTTNDVDRWGGTPAKGRQGIDAFKAAGADFVKVHDVDAMAREIYFAIAARAREVGLPLVGHLPNTITEIEASDSGQRTVEHFNEIHCWWPDGERGVDRLQLPSSYPLPDSAGIERCAAMVRTFARNGSWFVPTLTMTHVSWDTLPGRWPKWLRDNAKSGNAARSGMDVDPTVDQAHTVMRLLHRFGMPMLAGTDVPAAEGLLPGFSLHAELAFLVDDAGMTPLDALRAATLNPAKYLNATDTMGTVAQGKLADLVLLDADPLADITNTTMIRAVVANGRYFDRAVLDRLLAEGQAKVKQEP